MHVDLELLLEYDRWANREVLAALDAAPQAPPRARAIFAHIVAGPRRFLARAGAGPALPVWPEPQALDLAAELDRAHDDWRRLVGPGSNRSSDDPVTYVNSRGERWTSRLGDLAAHVVTHSAYHRGQIALLLGGAGFTPPYTDFVHAARSGLLASRPLSAGGAEARRVARPRAGGP